MWWRLKLTHYLKYRPCSCQQQPEKTIQMLTYFLPKIKIILLSATSRNGKSNTNLQTVQNPEHAHVSNKQEETPRCWHTNYAKPRVCPFQRQAGRASQMLTYILFKTQSKLLSVTSKKGQPDADLHAVQNPEHAPVSNKQEGSARCWLTACWKACSCQKQEEMAFQMLTYILFKTKSMLLSATSSNG